MEALKIGIMEMLPPTKKPEPLKVAFAQYKDEDLNEMADWYRLSPVCRTSRARLIQALAVRWSTEPKADSWRMCELLFILPVPPWLVDTDMVRGLLKQVHPELNKLLVAAQSKIEAEAKGGQRSVPTFANIPHNSTYSEPQMLRGNGDSSQTMEQRIDEIRSNALECATMANKALAISTNCQRVAGHK